VCKQVARSAAVNLLSKWREIVDFCKSFKDCGIAIDKNLVDFVVC
jgi:hypothetical protein